MTTATKRQCVARSKQTQERCKARPAPGSTVCRHHGARAPQTAAKAQTRVAEEKARRTFGKLADVAVPVENPFAELASLAGEVVAWKDFIAERIANLEHLRYEGFAGEQLNSEVALFERALDRCVHTLATISKLDLDEKAIRVQDRQLDLVETALRAAFADVDLPRGQRSELIESFGRHLRAV